MDYPKSSILPSCLVESLFGVDLLVLIKSFKVYLCIPLYVFDSNIFLCNDKVIWFENKKNCNLVLIVFTCCQYVQVYCNADDILFIKSNNYFMLCMSGLLTACQMLQFLNLYFFQAKQKLLYYCVQNKTNIN